MTMYIFEENSCFLDFRGNPGNVREKPTRKTCFSCATSYKECAYKVNTLDNVFTYFSYDYYRTEPCCTTGARQGEPATARLDFV